ncbi:MAG: hypothetical protein PWQ82_847 [Thermosediminibacterales bacterium]|nr:hypothetical protein [Thermosediminibacterales bacterium]MDK2835934.1 hypothetical protein [Thermosediminibacterales bacterium]
MGIKKHLVIILVLTLSIGILLTGCGKQSPKQRFMEALEKSQEINTYYMKGNIKLNLSFPENGLNFKNRQMYQFLKDLNINIEGRTQKEPALSIMDLTIRFSGVNFDVQIYTKNAEMWMKLPMISSYLYIDDYAATGQMGEMFDNKLAKKVIDSLDDDSFIMEKGITLENNIKTDVITLNLKNGELKNAMRAMMTILDSAELIKTLERFEKNMKTENLELKFYLDNNSNIRREEINGKLTIDDEENPEKKIAIDVYGIFDISEINRKMEFEFPDFEKEQVVPMKSNNLPTLSKVGKF